MPFLKRLGFFLIGLSIGLIFLVFFLKKKSEETGTSFCYLPNCRVLKELRSKTPTYSADVQALLDSQKIDSTDIQYFLYEGDVDFGASDTKSTPCKIYRIEGMAGDKEAVLTVKNCENEIILEEIHIQNP